VKPIRSAGLVVLGAAAVLSSGWAVLPNLQNASAGNTGGSIGVGIGHERPHRVDSISYERDLAADPHESSFGTLQSDGTYCGVFCAESH
jgi:hypothetical protein